MNDAASNSLLLEWALQSCWAMEEGYLNKAFDVLLRHESGVRLTRAEILEVTGEVKKKQADYALSPSGVATICCHGIISKRASMFDDVSSGAGTSCEKLRSCFEQAVTDKDCKSIVLDVDSPGGSVDGVADLCDYIHSCRGKKPTTCFASGMICSAAYFIGSACDKICVSQDCLGGSIGVYTVKTDYSEALKEAGIKKVLITSGRFKGIGEPGLPVTQDVVSEMQAVVDEHKANFVEATARNRGMKIREAAKLATGQCWVGQKMVECGLADMVGTYQSVGATKKGRQAQAENNEPEAKTPMAEPMETHVGTALDIKGIVAEAIAAGRQSAAAETKAEMDALRAEVAQQITASKEHRSQLAKAGAALAMQQKAAKVETFLVAQSKKIHAYELDETNPRGNLRDLLMSLADDKADGMKASQLDMALGLIQARQEQKDTSGFKVGDGKTAPPAPKGLVDAGADTRRDELATWCDSMTGQLALERSRETKADVLKDWDEFAAGGNDKAMEHMHASYVEQNPIPVG